MIRPILKTIRALLKKIDKAVLVEKLKPQRNSQVKSNAVNFGAQEIIGTMLESLRDTKEIFLHPHDAENPNGARQ